MKPLALKSNWYANATFYPNSRRRPICNWNRVGFDVHKATIRPIVFGLLGAFYPRDGVMEWGAEGVRVKLRWTLRYCDYRVVARWSI
jgi:hypothetical protein